MKKNYPVDIEKHIETFNMLGDGVSIQDKDYKVLYQNDAHIGLVGRHIGEYCYKAYEKKNHRCKECPVAITFVDGTGHKAERKAPVGNGHIHVEITSSPIKDSEGNIIACVELVRNITSRKHAEEELEKIFNLTPEMLCIAGTDGYFKKLNKAWEKVLGYTVEELLIIPFMELIHPNDREGTTQQLEKLSMGREVFYFENRCQCKDGTYKILAWNANPIDDGNVYAAARDITEKRNVEARLKKSEKKYRKLVKNTSQGVGMMDENAKITFANRSMCEMFGYSIDELIGRSPSYFLDEENLEIFKEYLDTRKKGPVKPFEISFVKNDGSTLHTIISPQIIKDDNSSTIGSFALITDITERKQLEGALLEKTNFLNKIIEGSSVSMWISDAEGTAIRANSACLDFFGATEEEVLGKYNLFQDSVIKKEGFLPHIKRVFEKGEVADFIIDYDFGDVDHIDVANAKHKTLKTILTPVQGGDGRVSNVIVQAIDLTEIKKNERKLQESEERYRTLFENATDIIQIVRPDGQLLDVNSSWCDALGYSLEEARKLKVFDLLDPECEGECVVNFNRALTEGTTGIVDTVFRSKDGEKIILRGSANCIYRKGEPYFVNCIFHDITLRLRMEEELIKMHKLESIGILAGGIAHDFNNILTALTGNLSLARMHVEPGGKVHKRIEQAEKASMRARDLTQQLLTFSKGGNPVKHLASISELVKDSSQFVLRGSNVKCDFDLPADLWLVKLDEGQISQVLNNLLINADQAMPDGGTINIYAENIHIGSNEVPSLEEGDYVSVSVKDQGSGISEKYLTKIFDPYFSTKHKGHGLGLATAYSIVNNHKGILEVDSELGKGAVFRFYLPASSQKEVRLAFAGEDIHIGKGFVLLMDDEEAIREIGREMLEHLGYQVKTASDGRQTIELYSMAMQDNTPFDAVIMDLTVPGGMGGKETIGKLLKIDPSAMVIVSSGYANDSIMSNYKQYGFSGMVPKPYKIEDVSKILKSLLHSK